MVPQVRVQIVAVDRRGPSDPALVAAGPIPQRATEFAAGFDLLAWLSEPLVIEPGNWEKVACGFTMELPPGYEAQVRPRSGLALKHGITVLNAPGTIDSDYRGEVCTILVNLGKTPFTVQPGMRVSQMVVASVAPVELDVVTTLSESQRGEGGFGSTGLSGHSV